MTTANSLIAKIADGSTLERPAAEFLMEELLGGHIDTPYIVQFLQYLNLRPVTLSELSGFATVMRRYAAPVFSPPESKPKNMVDTCGTGGDASGTFNISTAAAIVASAAGARVAKHGNRSASSICGSADVLEALGVAIDLPLLRYGQAIREIGIGFLFAPTAHGAARHAAPARKQIGKRTIFNLLGPLTNPAGAQTQVVGVYSAELIDLVAATLNNLGVQRAFVLHGAGYLDEISLAGETQITELRDGVLHRFSVTPEDFGLKRTPLEALQGGTATENAALFHRIFQGELGARADIIIINAAAALLVSGHADNLCSAAELASAAILSGAALNKLEQLKTFTKQPDP
jgi:anthranilate phosphoribosyltransferase